MSPAQQTTPRAGAADYTQHRNQRTDHHAGVWVARTRPHAVRPKVASAAVGLSTLTAATKAMMNAEPEDYDQTQARATNSAQPTRRSCSTPVGASDPGTHGHPHKAESTAPAAKVMRRRLGPNSGL